MTTSSSLTEQLEALGPTFSGTLLSPNDDGYEEARQLHNGMIDKRPAVIARCAGVADVVDAVNLGRESSLEIVVRGGGHNVAGRATVDDGLMLDLSLMKGIHVDPGKRTVIAQGGVTWNELNRETQVHGLATPGGTVGTTGVAGLTLGGGIGWLMSRFGLALDNLLSVELVDAEGRVLRASASEHPDLLWALQGGGGNFGVATALEFKLHAVGPEITGGLLAHPFEKAGDVLRFYRDMTQSLSDDLAMLAGVLYHPDGSGAKIVGVGACHTGPAEDGEAAVQPIKALGTPVMDVMGPLPYSQLNSMMDGMFPRGALNYWKSSFISDLSDAAIDTIIERFDVVPSPMSKLFVESFHGAVTRIPATDTAYPHRRKGYNLLIISQWEDPSDSETNIAWARETHDAMAPFLSSERYVNYLGDDEGSGPVADAYGANFERLRKVKADYDPNNLFHMNQNIEPL
ncbi:MAG: FAD-binding oxidoreductase [Alphaproteobacteria bacterium]